MKHLALLVALLALSGKANAVSNYSGAQLSAKPAAAAFNTDLQVGDFSIFSIQIDLSDAHSATATAKMSQVINSDNETIYIAGVALPTGLGVVLSTGANYAVDGLTHGVTYYVIAASENYIKLASSANNAIAGTAVDISSHVLVSSATFTLTPQQLSSSATDGIVYQGSNDGVTFYSLSQSSVPYDTATAGALTSFLDYTGKIVRLKFTGPTSGALSINATLNGRR